MLFCQTQKALCFRLTKICISRSFSTFTRGFIVEKPSMSLEAPRMLDLRASQVLLKHSSCLFLSFVSFSLRHWQKRSHFVGSLSASMLIFLSASFPLQPSFRGQSDGQDRAMRQSSVIASSHSLSNTDIFAIPGPDNDIVNQMPVLRLWMLP